MRTRKVNNDIIHIITKKSTKTEKKEIMNLLEEKIVDAILNKKSVSVITSNPFAECRNILHIENYEVFEDYAYIGKDNFEINITPQDVDEIRYNKDTGFTFCKDNNEMCLMFN